MSASDIGFAHNYTNLFELYKPDEERWLRVAAGITDVSQAGNEEVADDNYYDGNGMKETEVTGGQLQLDFSGHRLYGDPAQDYVTGLMLDYMNRKTRLRWTAPDGSKLVGDVTITDIVSQGGAATDKSTFSFTAKFNGLPEFEPADTDAFPTSISVEDVSVSIGETKQLKVTIEPGDASQTVFYSVEDEEIAEVDSDGVVHGVATGETDVIVRSAVLPTIYGKATIIVA